MRFNIAIIATSTLTLFSTSSLATPLTVIQVVDNINTVATMSQNLQVIAGKITIVDGPLLALGLGQFNNLVTGFQAIVTTVTGDVTAMTDTPAFTNANDIDLISTAFSQFIQVHQALLNIVIGKAGLLTDLPLFGQPVVNVLRQLESVVDSLSLSLINMIPPDQAQVSAEKGSLDEELKNTITIYSGQAIVKRGARFRA